MPNFSPNHRVHKPVVRSRGGVVASQHVGAARIGAQILTEGGNAVDAAVATSFALGVLEPWMSGIGGGGMMIVRHADGKVDTVDFGMRAPAALALADYPLAEGEANDLFAWPAVQKDSNMTGPLSIAVPGVVDGLGVAYGAWGSKPWANLLAPAVNLAHQGLTVDWYATLMIAQCAGGLAKWPASADRFLPSGHPPPIPMAPTATSRLPMESLAKTLDTLMRNGPRAFYEGPLAERIAAESQALGSSLSAQDLAAYHAQILKPLCISYRDAKIWATPELTAGPTLAHVLRNHEEFQNLQSGPDTEWYLSLVNSLQTAYTKRLAEMGDINGGRDIGCTTHFTIADRDGTIVTLTQTLLSVFGSMVTLPETGILMNNGIFWFDPRKDNPNSLAPSKRCLSNMCPVVVERADGAVFGIGASGGRRIMPAVAQIATFTTDFCMDLEDALHCPRIDVSGTGLVLADSDLPEVVVNALASQFKTNVKKRTVYPSWFANISAVQVEARDRIGGTEPTLPWADAVTEI